MNSSASEALNGSSIRWRWGLCWLMFGSTILSYLDRQSIALVGPYVKNEFHLNNQGFGWLIAVFSLSYAFFQVPAGYLADRCDVRWIYGLAVGWWSLAAMAMAFSPTLGFLMALRALLGLGESFNWPCALKVTSSVLPPADRSLGNGIFNSGAAVGAVLGPLIVPILAISYGWRSTFLIVGSLGLIWVIGWYWMVAGSRGTILAGRESSISSLCHPISEEHFRFSVRLRWALGVVAGLSLVVASSFLRFGERSIWWAIACFMIGLLLVGRILPEQYLRGMDWAETLGHVVRLRRFWVLVVVSISINVCWSFLVYWLPTYFTDDRKFSYLAGGTLSALPFLAADFGNLGGGAFSRFLAGRGLEATKARVRVMSVSCLLIFPGSLVGWLGNDLLVVGLMILMAFGTAAFMANYFAFCQEVSAKHTGFVVGVLGGLGNLFVAGFIPMAGHVRDISHSFGPILLFVGLLPLVGLGALVFGWGKGITSTDASFPSASGRSLG